MAAWGALRRDHLRNILLIYAKPHELLRADAIYVGVLLTIAFLIMPAAAARPLSETPEQMAEYEKEKRWLAGSDAEREKAQEALRDLDRAASNEAVPRKWRE